MNIETHEKHDYINSNLSIFAYTNSSTIEKVIFMIAVSMVNPRIINISVVSLYARCHHRLQSWPLYIARNYHLLIMHRLLLNNLEFVRQESRFARALVLHVRRRLILQ